MDILCIGLMVCDIIVKPINENVFNVDSSRIDTLKITSGGDSLNTAINMSKLGMHVGLIGKVGNDTLGDYLINQASQLGVNTLKILRSNEYATSTSIVMVEKSGERHFIYYGMSNDSLSILDIDFDFLKGAKFVHVGSAMALNNLDGNGITELFKKSKSYGIKTSMDVTWDSTGKWLNKIDHALYYTDIFMPSYHEAKLISGCETPQEMRQFFQQYGISTLVIKLGSEGCYVTDFKDEFFIEVFDKVNVLDTTGAGDAFVSGFLTGLIKGWDIYKCGVFGNAVASLCVTEIGATTGTKSMSEVIEFIQEYTDSEKRNPFQTKLLNCN